MFQDAHINVLVSDFARAFSFYQEILGLPVIHRWGDSYAMFQAPGLVIGIHPGRKPEDSVKGNLSIGLRVPNMGEALTALKSKGLVFHAERKDETMRLAHFQDPDGTPLYLIEMKW